jgi:hypothetical protein
MIYKDMKPGSQSNIRYAIWERKDQWRRVHRGNELWGRNNQSISARAVEGRNYRTSFMSSSGRNNREEGPCSTVHI